MYLKPYEGVLLLSTLVVLVHIGDARETYVILKCCANAGSFPYGLEVMPFRMYSRGQK